MGTSLSFIRDAPRFTHNARARATSWKQLQHKTPFSVPVITSNINKVFGLQSVSRSRTTREFPMTAQATSAHSTDMPENTRAITRYIPTTYVYFDL